MYGKNSQSRTTDALIGGISDSFQLVGSRSGYGSPASRAAKRIIDGNVRPFYSSLFLDPEEANHLQCLAEQRRESRLALLTRQEETKRKIRNQSLVVKDWARSAPSMNRESTDGWSKYRISIDRQSRGSQNTEAKSRIPSVAPTSSRPGSQVAQFQDLKRRRALSLLNTDVPPHERLIVYRPPLLLTESQAVVENSLTKCANQPRYTRLSNICEKYAGERLERSTNKYFIVDAEQILSNIQRHDSRFSKRLVSLSRRSFTVDASLQ